jgi:hypothetical protein
MVLRLEDLTAQPSEQLERLWPFMGVSPPPLSTAAGAEAVKTVQPNPNRKYERRYCDALGHPDYGARQRQAHVSFRARFGDEIRGLPWGYDLDEWPCVRKVMAAHGL